MKKKEIERCTHVNLRTNPKDILETMLLELPTVKYFFQKDFGGKNKFLKKEDQMLDKALEEEKSQITDISEYISPKGNRWMSYNFVEFFPRAKYAQAWPTSFIYYETYGSCGAFFPLYRKSKKKKSNGRISEIYGVLVFTSHFFQRMSERTGKAYRSRELIQEFITTKETHAGQADEDGEVIMKFKGGYGFGVKRSDEPYVLEVRTYLTDEQLSPSQKRKCERIDAYAELIEDGTFIKEVSNHTAYHSTNTPEQDIEKAMHNLELAKKIGADRFIMLAGMVHVAFLKIMTDILGMKLSDISTAQNVVIGNETQECFSDFLNKYEKFDGSKATKEENDEFTKELVDCMAAAGRKLKIRSMTRDAIEKRIREVVESSKETCRKFENG